MTGCLLTTHVLSLSATEARILILVSLRIEHTTSSVVDYIVDVRGYLLEDHSSVLAARQCANQRIESKSKRTQRAFKGGRPTSSTILLAEFLQRTRSCVLSVLSTAPALTNCSQLLFGRVTRHTELNETFNAEYSRKTTLTDNAHCPQPHTT